MHQASAFSTRNYDLAQLARAGQRATRWRTCEPFVEERKQARDRVDGACVRNALRRCQPETSQVGRALGSVFVPRSPVDERAGLSICGRGRLDRGRSDVRYVRLPGPRRRRRRRRVRRRVCGAARRGTPPKHRVS